MKDPGGDILAVASRMPIRWLPERHRQPMRAYLEQGILPGDPLRQLLEGDAASVIAYAADVPDMAALLTWMKAYLPPCSWGNRDQVQLWIIYVRRARGRALLATFDEGDDHGKDAGAEAR